MSEELPAGWMRVDAPPEDRETSHALLHDGRILRVGRATCALLDLATGRWTETPGPAAKDVAERRIVTTAEGWVHASGGYVESTLHGVLDRCELYKPQANEWYEMPPLPEGRRSHAAVVARGRVFVIGGETNKTEESWFTRQRVFSWSPGETAWTNLPALPKAIESCRARVLEDESIIAWGSAVFRWDHVAWTSLGDGVGASAFIAIDGGFVQIGGHEHSEAKATVRMWTRDGDWKEGVALPAPRKSPSVVRLGDGRIAVIGGVTTRRQWIASEGSGGELDYEYRSFGYEDVLESPVKEVLVGSAASGWHGVAAPALGRCTAIVLPDGRVFVRGGDVTAIWTP